MEKNNDFITKNEEVIEGLECGNPALFFYMTRFQQLTVILLAMALKKSKGVYNEGDDIKIICSYTRVRKIIANNNGFDTSRKKMFYDGLDEFKTKTFLDVLILKDYKYNPDISTLEFVITSEAYNKIFSHIIKYDYDMLISFLNMTQKYAGMILYMLLNSDPSKSIVIHSHKLSEFIKYKDNLASYTKLVDLTKRVINPMMEEINNKTCFNIYLNYLDDTRGSYLEFTLRKKVYSNGEEMLIPLKDEIKLFFNSLNICKKKKVDDKITNIIDFKL